MYKQQKGKRTQGMKDMCIQSVGHIWAEDEMSGKVGLYEDWRAVKANETMTKIWMSVIHYVHGITLNSILLCTEESSRVSYHDVASGRQKRILTIRQAASVKHFTFSRTQWLKMHPKFLKCSKVIIEILWVHFDPVHFSPCLWSEMQPGCKQQEQTGTKLWWRREQKAENFQQLG